jgi:hypothetical protein
MASKPLRVRGGVVELEQMYIPPHCIWLEACSHLTMRSLLIVDLRRYPRTSPARPGFGIRLYPPAWSPSYRPGSNHERASPADLFASSTLMLRKQGDMLAPNSTFHPLDRELFLDLGVVTNYVTSVNWR